MYLEIFLFHFKLHIVLGVFETTDTRVELVEQGNQLGYIRFIVTHTAVYSMSIVLCNNKTLRIALKIEIGTVPLKKKT